MESEVRAGKDELKQDAGPRWVTEGLGPNVKGGSTEGHSHIVLVPLLATSLRLDR